jgi:tripartite ATP-independent transporter DctP family solute receptor
MRPGAGSGRPACAPPRAGGYDRLVLARSLGSAAFRLVALAAAASAVAGCPGSRDPAPPRRLVVATVHGDPHPTARALGLLAAEVAADPALGGRLELDLQLGGALGGERETLEKLRFGDLQLACASAALLAEVAPELGVLTLPYLFDGPEHLWQALDGAPGEELLATLEPHGLVGLAWYDAGSRSFYNRRRPIRHPGDLQHLKIHVQQSEVMREMVQLLGGSPVVLGLPEVYTSLYTGDLDGAEDNLPSYWSARHFEVAGFYSLDEHARIPDLLLIGAPAWRALSPSQQVALRDLARRSAAAQRGFWNQAVDEARREVEAAGATVHEVDDLTPFRRAVAPLYERHAGRYGAWVARLREGAGELPMGVPPP